MTTTHPTLFDPAPDITRRRHRNSETSSEANRQIEPKKEQLRRQIVNFLELYPTGLTCKELSVQIPMHYTTASARLSEMKRDQVIELTGERRDGAAVVKLTRKDGVRPGDFR